MGTVCGRCGVRDAQLVETSTQDPDRLSNVQENNNARGDKDQDPDPSANSADGETAENPLLHEHFFLVMQAGLLSTAQYLFVHHTGEEYPGSAPLSASAVTQANLLLSYRHPILPKHDLAPSLHQYSPDTLLLQLADVVNVHPWQDEVTVTVITVAVINNHAHCLRWLLTLARATSDHHQHSQALKDDTCIQAATEGIDDEKDFSKVHTVLGLNLLQLAVCLEHIDCLRVIIDHLLNLPSDCKAFTSMLQSPLPDGRSVVQVAMEKGHLQMLEVLLQPALLSAYHLHERQDLRTGNTALHAAAVRCDVALLRMLLEALLQMTQSSVAVQSTSEGETPWTADTSTHTPLTPQEDGKKTLRILLHALNRSGQTAEDILEDRVAQVNAELTKLRELSSDEGVNTAQLHATFPPQSWTSASSDWMTTKTTSSPMSSAPLSRQPTPARFSWSASRQSSTEHAATSPILSIRQQEERALLEKLDQGMTCLTLLQEFASQSFSVSLSASEPLPMRLVEELPLSPQVTFRPLQEEGRLLSFGGHTDTSDGGQTAIADEERDEEQVPSFWIPASFTKSLSQSAVPLSVDTKSFVSITPVPSRAQRSRSLSSSHHQDDRNVLFWVQQAQQKDEEENDTLDSSDKIETTEPMTACSWSPANEREYHRAYGRHLREHGHLYG